MYYKCVLISALQYLLWITLFIMKDHIFMMIFRYLSKLQKKVKIIN